MGFSHKYNTDDVVIRAAIVGLVNELNNRISFYNTWEDDKKQLVRVPFFYAMSGDERFLQDAFSNWNDCYPDFIEGNTDPIPRGTLWLSGVSILGSNLTSRYVRGYYTKEIDGQLQRFNSYINSIPLQLNFSAEIMVDTAIDSFKVMQSAMATLYKTLVFSVNYNGFRIPTQAGFPESYASTKQFEFTYGVTDRTKVTFDIELQTYLPIPDDAQEFFAGNNIQGFSGTLHTGNDDNNENIQVTPPDTVNLSPNAADYTNQPPSSSVNIPGQQDPSNNEGSAGTGENYGSDYWR